MGTPAPDSVKRLVDRFDQDRSVFLSADYKEEQLRAESLNPFFTALGWDMDNKAGLSNLSACNAQAETFKQVIHEETIRVAGGKCGTLPIFPSAVKARHDRMAGFAESDECGAIGEGRRGKARNDE